MKLTEFRKAWIGREIERYAKQLGIPGQEIPRIVLTRKEWLQLPRELTKGRRTITHRIYGTTIPPKYTLVFLNVRKHKTLRELRKTIIHQLWLCRFRIATKDRDVMGKRIGQLLKGRSFPLRGVNADLTRYVE